MLEIWWFPEEQLSPTWSAHTNIPHSTRVFSEETAVLKQSNEGKKISIWFVELGLYEAARPEIFAFATGFFARIETAFSWKSPLSFRSRPIHTHVDLVKSLCLITSSNKCLGREKWREWVWNNWRNLPAKKLPRTWKPTCGDVTNAKNYGRLLCPSINRICEIRKSRW